MTWKLKTTRWNNFSLHWSRSISPRRKFSKGFSGKPTWVGVISVGRRWRALGDPITIVSGSLSSKYNQKKYSYNLPGSLPPEHRRFPTSSPIEWAEHHLSKEIACRELIKWRRNVSCGNQKWERGFANQLIIQFLDGGWPYWVDTTIFQHKHCQVSEPNFRLSLQYPNEKSYTTNPRRL